MDISLTQTSEPVLEDRFEQEEINPNLLELLKKNYRTNKEGLHELAGDFLERGKYISSSFNAFINYNFGKVKEITAIEYAKAKILRGKKESHEQLKALDLYYLTNRTKIELVGFFDIKEKGKKYTHEDLTLYTMNSVDERAKHKNYWRKFLKKYFPREDGVEGLRIVKRLEEINNIKAKEMRDCLYRLIEKED